MAFLLKLTPRAPKFILYLMAGLMWAFVGIFLNRYSYYWLQEFDLPIVLILIAAGVALALAINHWGFSKLALENIHRIENIEAKNPCIFAFQKWSSYPLIAFMIALGIFLRIYSSVPVFILTPMYIGIGGSLFLGSFQYFHKLFFPNKVVQKAD